MGEEREEGSEAALRRRHGRRRGVDRRSRDMDMRCPATMRKAGTLALALSSALRCREMIGGPISGLGATSPPPEPHLTPHPIPVPSRLTTNICLHTSSITRHLTRPCQQLSTPLSCSIGQSAAASASSSETAAPIPARLALLLDPAIAPISPCLLRCSLVISSVFCRMAAVLRRQRVPPA